MYGIRFWTERCSDRGYMTHSATGLAQDRKHTVSREYIQEHYTDVTENDGTIACKDHKGSERVFEATSINGWFTENRNR